jgi:hypothetical protein
MKSKNCINPYYCLIIYTRKLFSYQIVMQYSDNSIIHFKLNSSSLFSLTLELKFLYDR